jgi:hypothetical protein
MQIVSYGGGTNSTAMLIEMIKRGELCDFITFADTGGERPETYKYVEMFSEYLTKNGYPGIEIVKKVDKNGNVLTLEQNCLNEKMLPSIAYGFKSCSHKYKIQPQNKFYNNNDLAKQEWKNGNKITKLIGYDADEYHRAKIAQDDKYNYRYPLIEWNIGRDECIEIIKNADLQLPGKSSCFFCPNSKKQEILSLPCNLQARAIAMEENAELTHIKGLGRNYSWKELIQFNQRQLDLFEDFDNTKDQICECYD